jgi:hypothetical protein
MRKIVLGFSALALMLALQSAALAQVSQFEGNWVNVDPNTSGVTKLNINEFSLFGIRIITLRAWGQCSPTDCDWGTVGATAYAPNVSSDLEATARSLTATFNPGFAVKSVVIRPARGGRLQADIYTRFTDGSGRTNYDATYIFRPEGIGDDCLLYNPKELKIVDEGASGWLLTDGRSRMLLLDNKQDAEKALALAQRYTAHCFIGRENTKPNRDEFVHEYWMGDSGVATVIPNEDCIPYDPNTLQIVDEGAGGFLLTDGFSRMALYASLEDAQEGLRVAKLASKQCFIGRDNTRPNRKAYIVEYWK